MAKASSLISDLTGSKRRKNEAEETGQAPFLLKVKSSKTEMESRGNSAQILTESKELVVTEEEFK